MSRSGEVRVRFVASTNGMFDAVAANQERVLEGYWRMVLEGIGGVLGGIGGYWRVLEGIGGYRLRCKCFPCK